MHYFVTLIVGLLLLLNSVVFAQDKPTLTVYTTAAFSGKTGAGQTIKQAFELECDCVVDFVNNDNATNILHRIRQEGEQSPADVVLGLDNSQTVEAQNTGLIAEHSVDLKDLDMPLPWRNQNFLPYDFGFFAFIYDSDKTKRIPTSFEQLLAAAPALTLVILDPLSNSAGLGLLLWVKALYGEQADAVWTKLAPRIVAVAKDRADALQLFQNGQADMVLGYTTTPAYLLLETGHKNYHAASFSEGHGMQIEVAALLKNAPQPVLADRFLQFLASTSFQDAIPSANWMYPVVFPKKGLPAEFRDLIKPLKTLIIDAQGIADNKADWIDEFHQAVNK